MDVVERFLKLVAIESASDEYSKSSPSTKTQFDVADEIVRQMKEIGISDAACDEHGYVYGTIEANCSDDIPVYGLIAHMDTSPDACGKDIHPKIIGPYDGGSIMLNNELNISMSPDIFPSLKLHEGKHLIVTDGTTLLGADDKAGAAEILAAADFILHSDRRHGKIRLGFTPDEEIGRGTDFFDIRHFGADFAYTVDGGRIGEFEYENFNAAGAKITINGKSVHPGSAKDIMVNASLVAIELNSLLPFDETPFHTDKYQGFYHLTHIDGECEKAVLRYIIRDHDMEIFQMRKKVMAGAVDSINLKYGEGTAVLEMKDSYYNMKEIIEKHKFLVDDAVEAFSVNGVDTVCVPIRGGTDGARLSFEGLPCPNICTGGENFHGRFEYCVCEDMQTISQSLAELMFIVAKQH